MQRNNIVFNKFLQKIHSSVLYYFQLRKKSVIVVMKMLKNFGTV